MNLLIATTNPGKVREFREMLGVEVSSLADLDAYDEVPETGRTFLQNACLKASGYAKQTGRTVIADDSGLEVDALGGAPGVNSARFASDHGAGSGDADNNRLLLAKLADVPDEQRTARFRCVLAVAAPDGAILLTAAGSCEGSILREPRGDNGFGYDPLFLLAGSERTTAELSPAEKHAASHRGAAMRRLKRLMADVDIPARPAMIGA